MEAVSRRIYRLRKHTPSGEVVSDPDSPTRVRKLCTQAVNDDRKSRPVSRSGHRKGRQHGCVTQSEPRASASGLSGATVRAVIPRAYAWGSDQCRLDCHGPGWVGCCRIGGALGNRAPGRARLPPSHHAHDTRTSRLARRLALPGPPGPFRIVDGSRLFFGADRRQ